MLFGYVIAEMSVEELREYMCEVQHYEETVADMVYAQNHLIEALHNTLRQEEWRNEAVIKYNRAVSSKRALERQIEQNHKDACTGHVCYCEPNVADHTEPSTDCSWK